MNERTPEGRIIVIGRDTRRNNNGGPGVRQLVVELADKKVRHYNTNSVQRAK